MAYRRPKSDVGCSVGIKPYLHVGALGQLSGCVTVAEISPHSTQATTKTAGLRDHGGKWSMMLLAASASGGFRKRSAPDEDEPA